ncbi:MAG: tRNA (guanosine(37)-N1)-methyltransferase TrmD [Acidobacteriota bacterium]|jgi:tRNA (guanine37-N1)-methyltransferase|nr:tRNA (guanosine(37)-N1)-methyltransferase TrmD [Acidobacteriota bacterium]NLT33380.1 tRNA (guanosine(37)-N1)-methyltransferase TrmD [Acidobacteriota bacterium]
MRFDIITVFPELFAGVLECGIIRRARRSGLADVRLVNLRDFTRDRHRSVDDRPYGGGEGMVFMPGPLFEAIESCLESGDEGKGRVVLLSPQGKTWSQDLAAEYSTIPHLILVCGRYEGVDQRVIDHLVDQEISIGDFVLTGGEIPAMVLLDSIVRLIPGALGCRDSALNESFSSGLLDYPQYTRPAEYRGHAVPEVLLSGDHARIAEWRKEQALEKTKRARPELITER